MHSISGQLLRIPVVTAMALARLLILPRLAADISYVYDHAGRLP